MLSADLLSPCPLSSLLTFCAPSPLALSLLTSPFLYDTFSLSCSIFFVLSISLSLPISLSFPPLCFSMPFFCLVSLSLSLSVSLSRSVSVSLFLSLAFSVSLSLCLSVSSLCLCLFSLSVSLSLCLSLSLSLSVSVYLCLSLCVCVCLCLNTARAKEFRVNFSEVLQGKRMFCWFFINARLSCSHKSHS